VIRDDLVEKSRPRVFTTNPDDPESGRTFVWALTKWYERAVGETGAVAFPPLAESEEELRGTLSASDSASLTEVDDTFAAMVRDEFLQQAPLYPEASELSDQQVER
jgi:hypothetical protein